MAAVNKARTTRPYLYTYDFNAKHTTGTTEPGINVVCTVEQGKLAIGSTVTLRVNRVEETARHQPCAGSDRSLRQFAGRQLLYHRTAKHPTGK